MKNLFSIVLLFTALLSSAQEKKEALKSQIVEVSCGECNFGMKGKSCDLAVRIDGKTYFVDGTKIDDHGNAHAKDGFCEVIRKAEVTGEIVNNRFQATTFILLPEEK
jgi:hypothetical protein